MKNLVTFVIIIAALAAGGGFLIWQQQQQLDELAFQKKLAERRTLFARQAAITIQVPKERLDFDRRQLISDHIDGVEALYKEHPAQLKPDAFIKEREQKAKEGKKDKARVAEYRERYDFLKERFEVLKRGYTPVLTGYQNGMRFDIVEVKKTDADGKQSLRLDVFVWGPVEQQLGFGGIEIQFVREIKETDARGREKVKKVLAKVEGAGPPYIFHEDPHNWIPEWPPGVMVGYYQGLPLFPPDATKFSLKMDFTLRTSAGTPLPVELKWENVDVDPAWRAPEGTVFEAEVMEATEEELKAAGISLD